MSLVVKKVGDDLGVLDKSWGFSYFILNFLYLKGSFCHAQNEGTDFSGKHLILLLLL